MPVVPSVVVVLAAHGSRAEASNEAHRELCAAVSEASGHRVQPGFLELAQPSIGASIDEAVAIGARRVIVLPHFLAPGRHLREDVPAIVALATVRHPNIGVDMIGHTGGDPRLVELLADLVRGAT